LKSVSVMIAIVAPVVLLQSVLAQWYVPLIFGERWLEAVPVIELLCWFGIPLMVLRLCSIFLRARSAVKLELQMSVSHTVLGIGCLVAALPIGLVNALSLQLAVTCTTAAICLFITFQSTRLNQVDSI
jgi:O-antigen/teichoic acid export membrane protein